MEIGSADLTDLQAGIQTSDSDAYVKAILCRGESGWNLYHAQVLVGAEPPGWEMQIWRYAELAFISCVVRAAELASICTPGGGAIVLGGQEVLVAGALGRANWTKRPSFARHDLWQLPWPVTD